MESKCYLCDNKALHAFEKENINFVRCAGCGLVFVSPMPEDSDIEKNYGGKSSITRDKLGDKTAAKMVKRMQYRLSIVEKYSGKKGRLLDIGCGGGDFLSVAKDSGWQCAGVELSSGDCAYLRKRLKVEAYDKPLRGISLPVGAFDAVTLFHVIEHFRDPLGELKEIHRILNDDGILLAELPNIDALVFRLKGINWKYINAEHVFYYNRKTAAELLKQAGFDLLYITGISGLDWWTGLAPVKRMLHRLVTASGIGDHLVIVAKKIKII